MNATLSWRASGGATAFSSFSVATSKVSMLVAFAMDGLLPRVLAGVVLTFAGATVLVVLVLLYTFEDVVGGTCGEMSGKRLYSGRRALSSAVGSGGGILPIWLTPSTREEAAPLPAAEPPPPPTAAMGPAPPPALPCELIAGRIGKGLFEGPAVPRMRDGDPGDGTRGPKPAPANYERGARSACSAAAASVGALRERPRRLNAAPTAPGDAVLQAGMGAAHHGQHSSHHRGGDLPTAQLQQMVQNKCSHSKALPPEVCSFCNSSAPEKLLDICFDYINKHLLDTICYEDPVTGKLSLNIGLTLPVEICERLLSVRSNSFMPVHTNFVNIFKDTNCTRLKRVRLRKSKIQDADLEILLRHRLIELEICRGLDLTHNCVKYITEYGSSLLSLTIEDCPRIFPSNIISKLDFDEEPFYNNHIFLHLI
nr:unnamed protein product [Callosobruchus analis]